MKLVIPNSTPLLSQGSLSLNNLTDRHSSIRSNPQTGRIGADHRSGLNCCCHALFQLPPPTVCLTCIFLTLCRTSCSCVKWQLICCAFAASLNSQCFWEVVLGCSWIRMWLNLTNLWSPPLLNRICWFHRSQLQHSRVVKFSKSQQ